MKHTNITTVILAGLLLFCACGQNGAKGAKTSSKSPTPDWTPGSFRLERPWEWEVVKAAYDIWQERGVWNDQTFTAIDSVVMKYLSKRQISLPDNPKKALDRLETLVTHEFSLDDYDDSNMGMLSASGNERIWKRYIGWKYERTAKERCPQIDWDTEKARLDTLSARISDCLYWVGGSYAWMAYALVDSENLGCIRNIRNCCINGYTDDSCAEIPDEKFREIFKEAKQIRFYVASGADEYEEERPDLIANLEAAFREWKNWRRKSFRTLEAEDKRLAEAYISASRPFERSLFIDLKNHFENCAATNEYVWSKLLHGDCTDEQMYAYSYEESMKEN